MWNVEIQNNDAFAFRKQPQQRLFESKYQNG